MCLAQQTITVDTCSYAPATGVLTINGQAVNALSVNSLTATSVTAQSLTLQSSGVPTPNGTYNVTITGATATAPGTATLTTATSGPTYLAPLTVGPAAGVTAQFGQRGSGTITLPAGTTKWWIAASYGPYSSNLDFPWDALLIVNTLPTATTTGQAVVYYKNVSAKPETFTGATFIVAVQ